MLERPVAIAIIFIGVLLSAFGSLAESAILSTNRLRVRHMLEGSAGKAAAIERLLARPRQVLSSLVFINSVAAVIAASVGVELARDILGASIGLWSIAVGIAAIALIILVFGEILPKAIASQSPERTALLIMRPVEIASWLLGPIVGALEGITGLILRPFGWRADVQPPLVSEEELQLLLSVGHEQGLIEEDEREMISGIFELEETTVREVMRPRIDIVAADAATDLASVVRLIIDHGYSRVPVYDGTIDAVVGVVYAKDVLAVLAEGRTATPREIARPAHFVPDSLRIDELLHELQGMRVHLAVVVDEYGGTAGLVTIEDLLEQIVGEIRDEYDREEEPIVEVGDGEWIVSGLEPLGNVADASGLSLADPEVDTIGGYVASRLGRIPAVGDTVSGDDWSMAVIATTGRRIRTLRIRRSGGERADNA